MSIGINIPIIKKITRKLWELGHLEELLVQVLEPNAIKTDLNRITHPNFLCSQKLRS